MGRKKKYNTIEEKRIANNIARKLYYHKNKNTINKKRMEKYYEERIEELQKKLSEMRQSD